MQASSEGSDLTVEVVMTIQRKCFIISLKILIHSLPKFGSSIPGIFSNTVSQISPLPKKNSVVCYTLVMRQILHF